MTKIVEKSSEKTILLNRVGFKDSDPLILMLAPLGTGLASMVLVAGGLDMFFLPDEASATIGAIGATAAAASALVTVVAVQAQTVISELESYTGTYIKKLGMLKTTLNMLTPFGQKMKTGKKSLALSKEVTANLIGGSESVHSSYYGYSGSKNKTTTHEVETELVFKPTGAYIKQTVVPSATSVWDEAFDSTVEVHKFRKPKALNSKPREKHYADSAF